MKINSSNLYPVNQIIPNKIVKFGQTSPQSAQTQSGRCYFMGIQDYNVKTPMSYSHIEDIKLPNNLTANYYKLANGQKVIIIPKDGRTVVKTFVNTGSLNEPDRIRGISHYIEHNLFNGSEDLGNEVFFDEVNKMGASTNASTSFANTNYYILSNLLDDSDLENSIRLHAGMIQSPKFMQDKLDKEKKIVNSEINMGLSDENSRAFTLTLKNLFNIKSTSPDLVAGSTDRIDALTREDVVNYFNNNYYPANMVTVISGEVEPNQTMGLISKYFTSTRTPNASRYYEKMTPIENPVREDIISTKNTGAANIIIAFAGPENGNATDRVYMRAINTLIAGFANSKLDKIGVKYSTDISQTTERIGSRPQDKMACMFECRLPEKNVEPLLKDFYNVITDVVNNPPTPQEFEAVKNKIKKTNEKNMQWSEGLNNNIGMDFLNGVPYMTAQYSSILDNMTYADFINTTKKYYDLNKVAITVVHPKGTDINEIQNNYKKNINNISFTGLNKKTPVDVSKINQYTLPNNFKLVIQDVDSNLVNYNIDFVSNRWQTQNPVLVDVLNEMLAYAGTMQHSWDDLASITAQNAIGDIISASNKGVSVTSDFTYDKTAMALNLFKEKLYYADLNQKLFDMAVQYCKDRYSTYETDAEDKFGKAMYKNTPYSLTNQEKLDILSKITLNDVKQLYSKMFQQGQGQVVVTGPFSKHPELFPLVYNDTAAFYPVQPADISLIKSDSPTIDKTEVHTVETNRNQAKIMEGFKFKQNGNVKDDICIFIMNYILGGSTASRLFTDLREKRHLAYNVESYYDMTDDFGVMTLQIGTTTNNVETGEKTLDNIKKSIEGFNENIARITSEKVTEEELAAAKKALKSGMLSGLELNACKNDMLSDDLRSPYGLNYYNEKFKLIDSITTEDILNTAKNIFSSKTVYSIAATKEALDANMEYLEQLKD